MRVLAQLERLAAKLQGKGWGTETVSREVAAASRFLTKDAKLCIDIGGNKGLYTHALRARFPDSRIVTFEPSSTNLNILHAAFDADTQIEILPYAVAETASQQTLYADVPGSGLSSLTQRDLRHIGLNMDPVETVQTLRFEDFWHEHLSSAPIDLVKLDIEGHELFALRGFGEAIEHVRVVQFEFGGCNIDTRTYIRDFWHFFIDHGFDLYLMGPLGLTRLTRYREQVEHFGTANYLAINRQALEKRL